MRESIEQLIEVYENRVRSAIRILDDPSTAYEQRVRVQGKREAYNGMIMELKDVLKHVSQIRSEENNN